MNEAQQIMGAQAVPLSAPIKAHGEDLQTLQLRRPTVAETRKIGRLPYRLRDQSGQFDPDTGVVSEYLVICAGIPQSSVDQIDLADFNKLAWMICSFFATPASSASSN